MPHTILVTRTADGVNAVSRAVVCSRECGDVARARVTPRHPVRGHQVTVVEQECAGACAACGVFVPPRFIDGEHTPETLISDE